MTSAADLRASLGLSAASVFRDLVGESDSDRLDFIKTIHINNQHRYLLVHARVSTQIQQAQSFALTPRAEALLASGGSVNVETFTASCGTQFVYGRVLGGELFAVMDFDMPTTDEQQDFVAAIASMQGWQPSGNIDAAMRLFAMFAAPKIVTYQLALATDAPIAQFHSVKDFAEGFPSLVRSAGPVALTMLTKGYHEVASVAGLDASTFASQESVMTQLASVRDTAAEDFDTETYIQAHPDQYQLFNPSDLNETAVNQYLNVVDQAAVNCMADMWHGCVLPTDSLPVMNFPARIPTVTSSMTADSGLSGVTFSVPAAFSQYGSTKNYGSTVRYYGLPASVIPDAGLTLFEIQVGREACTSAASVVDGLAANMPVPFTPQRDLLSGGLLNAHSISWAGGGQSDMSVVLDPSPTDHLCTVLSIDLYDADTPWSQLPNTLDVIRQIVLSAHY